MRSEKYLLTGAILSCIAVLRTQCKLALTADSTPELDNLRAELAVERGMRMKLEFELMHKHCNSPRNMDGRNWCCGNERHHWTEQQWIETARSMRLA
jgi:hypothetical protein